MSAVLSHIDLEMDPFVPDRGFVSPANQSLDRFSDWAQLVRRTAGTGLKAHILVVLEV